jgi:altronate dehydratase small subunit
MAKYAKLISEKDNVVTVVADCAAGDEIIVKFHGTETMYECNENIQFGHKMAIADLKQGEKVIKYGESIGSASRDIRKGEWVHTHNVLDEYRCLDKSGVPLPGQ